MVIQILFPPIKKQVVLISKYKAQRVKETIANSVQLLAVPIEILRVPIWFS